MSKQYRALVGLTYPASDKDVTLRQAGKECEWKSVEAGDIIGDIPEISVKWLLADGRIAEADKAVDGGNLRPK
jgi:hypothetical protein